MHGWGPERWSRREFIRGLAVAGAAGLVGARPDSAAAEPPPETTKLTLVESPITCLAPHYVAQELLHGEGFTDVRYLKWPSETQNWVPEVLLSGEADVSLSFVPSDVVHIEAGAPVVILAGSHIGCVELVGGNRVKSVHDLKGKTVGVLKRRSDEEIFISTFAKYVGLNPTAINWVLREPDSLQLLAEGKIDALMTGPPFSIELRQRKIGHVLVNTTTEPPWSHYFCCLVASTREFVRKNPVATKRALRAIVKAADVCALEPNRVARLIADKGLASYENTLRMLQDIPYGKWREYDTEDSVRFFALRMREVGYVNTTPGRIIAQGTDFRFLNELKKELKG
jgi:NitT/TauT family transport system substrate-binding protein